MNREQDKELDDQIDIIINHAIIMDDCNQDPLAVNALARKSIKYLFSTHYITKEESDKAVLEAKTQSEYDTWVWLKENLIEECSEYYPTLESNLERTLSELKAGKL